MKAGARVVMALVGAGYWLALAGAAAGANRLTNGGFRHGVDGLTSADVAAQVRRRGGTNTAGEWFQGVRAHADLGGDGFANWAEYRTGSDSREAQAFPQADPLVGNRACMAMQRTGQADILFAVQFAGSISPSVREHERGPAAGSGGLMSYTNAMREDAQRGCQGGAGRSPAGANCYAPNDPRIAYQGRWDAGDPAGPQAEWGAVGLTFRFTGAQADLLVREITKWPSPANPQAGNYLAISVDGGPYTRVPLQTHARHYRIVDEPLSGVHTVRVVKRTEAWVGRIQVLGLELPEGGMLETPPPAPARRLEIIGDSVTSGYGIEAPAATNTYHPATVNATLTYGWLAAAAVTADCRLISWSGRGVWRNVDGSTNGTLPELYSRALPWEPASVWDLAQWVPQAVVITLGANDFGIGSPPESDFCTAYIGLVNRVRDAYGEPAIFCCLSSTPNDDWPIGQYRRTTLRTWLTHIVNGFAAKGITNVSYLEFAQQEPADGYGADYHPSAVTHQKMAGVLRAALVQRVNW